MKAIILFIGPDIHASRVLELGCGIGRLTKPLAEQAVHVTAVDMCDRMIRRASQELGQVTNVQFRTGFAQDYTSRRRFDVVVSCLVLIHNVDEDEFQAAIAVACRAKNAVFVFEDVTQGRKASSHTRLRTREEIKEAFANHGFQVSRERTFVLQGDEIAFLKFTSAKTKPPK